MSPQTSSGSLSLISTLFRSASMPSPLSPGSPPGRFLPDYRFSPESAPRLRSSPQYLCTPDAAHEKLPVRMEKALTVLIRMEREDPIT